MKITLGFLLLSTLAASTAGSSSSSSSVTNSHIEISEVRADSKFGMDLLSKATRDLANNNNQQQQQNQGEDTTWVSGYSLVFQGCHQITQWNTQADGDQDVRIETKRLAKFRLCPSNSCNSSSGSGCRSGYGEYIVDMDVFLQTYIENKREAEEAAGYYRAQNQYNIDVDDYLYCSRFEGIQNNRNLANNNNNNNNGNEYYIGPYCSDTGGKIVLGMFTDDTCTQFADDYGGVYTYKTMTGVELPHSSTSIVDTTCMSCMDNNNNNGGGGYQPKDECLDLYSSAGKCEQNLSSYSGNSNTNNNACNYLKGIKTTTRSGVIVNGRVSANRVASAFIGIFSVSFVLLGSYVYYLRTKLNRSKVFLSD